MLRPLKALTLTSAVLTASFFATGCGSSDHTQVRFVHALQDAGALDVEVNGTVDFTDISFLGVQPNQPGYTPVPSGTDTIKAVATGTTTQTFSATATFSGSGHYTVVATGFSQTGNHGSNVALLSVPDNNSGAPSGDVSFRVIHASPSGPGNVDVYILLNPATCPSGTPAISGLGYTQGSSYVSLAYNPNNATPPPGFTVCVTAAGSLQRIFSEPTDPGTAGAVRTLVLTDVQEGTSMQQSFLELSDVN
jgi:hypothetical protein